MKLKLKMSMKILAAINKCHYEYKDVLLNNKSIRHTVNFFRGFRELFPIRKNISPQNFCRYRNVHLSQPTLKSLYI